MGFVCFVFIVSIFNGASFYIGKIDDMTYVVYIIIWIFFLDVFSQQYVKSLQVLQSFDTTTDGNNTSENTADSDSKKES